MVYVKKLRVVGGVPYDEMGNRTDDEVPPFTDLVYYVSPYRKVFQIFWVWTAEGGVIYQALDYEDAINEIKYLTDPLSSEYVPNKKFRIFYLDYLFRKVWC